DRLFTVSTGGGQIDASGSAATATLSFTNTGVIAGPGAAATLTLTGTNTGANTLAPLLQDGAGVLSLTKSGTGTMALSNASNTYSGGTTINGGTLSVAADRDLGNTAGGVTID